MPNRSDRLIAIKPLADAANSFVELFSTAVAREGYRVCDFAWSDLSSGKADAVILHWPYELLGLGGWRGIRRWRRLYRDLRQARRRGTRMIWVAHNARPHDGGWLSNLLMRKFIRSIDAVIHLSAHSRQLINHLYRPPAHIVQIETVHGHYLDVMRTPASAAPILLDEVRLSYFGQIRAYKNIETLAALIAAGPANVSLGISGRRAHEHVAAGLEKIALGAPNLKLDLRREALPDEDIERCVDDAHAVILPYQAVLNSGAAIFALSRARPVLAPNTGSLPELQTLVGREWLQLYDGEISAAIAESFVRWLRGRPPLDKPDLSALAWNRIGGDIAGLLDRLLDRR